MSKITDARREFLTELLVEKMVDEMELEDLINYFMEKQEEFLIDQPEEDFLDICEFHDIDWKED